MRSWSKWKSFSRKWKSSSSDGPAIADPQRVLVVRDRDALLSRQGRPADIRHLVGLTARPALDVLVAVVNLLTLVTHVDRLVFASRPSTPSFRAPARAK